MSNIKTHEQKLVEELKKQDPFIKQEDMEKEILEAVRYKYALDDYQLELKRLYIQELVSNHY